LNRSTAIRLGNLLRVELERGRSQMRIAGHPRPYFLSYLLRHDEEWRIEAKFGALTVDGHETRRNCLADVRVGSYRNDQVRSGGLEDNSTDVESYGMLALPVDGPGDGLQHGIWQLTEARYREAIDDLLRRRAAELSYLDESRRLPSFERRSAIEDVRFRALPALDQDAARKLARRASAEMRRYPFIRDGAVKISAVNALRIFVSSEGSFIVECRPYRAVDYDVWYLSPQGTSLSKTRSWFVTDPNELPDLAAVKRDIKATYRRLDALAKAPVIRSFSGPVLLDPKPAGLLIHEAIGHRLEGNRLRSAGEGQTFRDSVGQQVLPEGVTVRDDPSMAHFEGRSLVGHYVYDDEGVPAGNAPLITDGVLEGFLTSRTPAGARHHSNGHGRSAHHARAMSRMGVTIVQAKDGLGGDELFRAFVEEIRAQEVPWGIRIIDASGGETSTDSYDFQAFLGQIDCAARVYPDGRQELVRGVDFVGTPLNAVRGIIAAGRRMEVDNAWCGAESGYVPVTTISPSLLVEELELQQKPSRQVTQFAYPMPWQK